jgi:hypothetical protein
MKVRGTFFTCKEDDIEELRRTEEILNRTIENNSNNIALYTDEDECIGVALKAWVDEDHIVIEYEADEKYRDELVKEGFSITC